MKGILVIDMPIDCDECPLNSNGYCDVLQEYAFLNEWVEEAPYYSLMGKGDCPLKPIPQRKLTDLEKTNDYSCGWEQGYNACLGEILGEEE